MNIRDIDLYIINFFKKYWIAVARVSLAIVFVWFGGLKVLGFSPASALVQGLFNQTITFVAFDTFYAFFAWFEVLIGVLFLIPKLTRVVIPLLFIHMITTFGPLVLLPTETWDGFMIPTLTGQYIIKNVVIIAIAMGIAARLHPMQKKA